MAGSPNFKEPATIGSWSPERSTWGRARKAFRQEAKEFCLFTGLHGYKYIVQPGKHRAERLFWILVVTVSLVAAVLLMMIAYDFNRSHPTILAVDTTHYPLWAVDAPGVTVCPSNKVLRSKARQLLKTMCVSRAVRASPRRARPALRSLVRRVLPADVSEEELLDELGLLVELIVPRSNNATKFARLQNILDKNSLSIDEVMRQVTPSCDDLLIRCIWKRRQCLHCSDIFRQVPTAYGYCCSFNYMDRDLDAYRPRMGGCVGVSYNQVQRLSACGYTNGLSVTVRIQPKEFLSSFLASHAVLVLIHNPTQYPDGNADLKIVGAGTVSFISYMAEVTLPSDRIATLKSSIRKCQFESETYLPMFRAYTYENCMASCQANRTMQKSGLLGIEENYALFHVFANDLVTTKYKMDVYMTREDLLGSLGGLSGLLVGFSLVSGFEFVYFFTIRPFFRMRARRAASREESRTASAAQDAVKGLGNSASSI
ncbi:hypothetical protein FOCC_FOCC017456, partial [Frankliniella occidentalis]